MNKSRGFCFTINNYDDSDLIDCLYIEKSGICRYIVVGFELGETRTPHIQGYVYFDNAISFDSIKNKLPRAHIEKQKAKDNSKAALYCKKDGDFYEWGQLPEQGKRSDLKDIATRAASGENIETLRKDYPAQCMMYTKQILALTRKNNNKECQVYIYKGEDLIRWVSQNLDSYLIITEMRDLFEYTDEQVCVFTCVIPATELNMMARNMPILVRNGYETRKLLPPMIIVDDVFFSRKSSIVDLIEFLRDDTPWHTSGLGNTNQTNSEPFEISIDCELN